MSHKLPRELRDLVYRELVIGPNRIKVCYDCKENFLYLRLLDGEGGVTTSFLCDAVDQSQIAAEVYEEFFRNNTFDCDNCANLDLLLRSSTTALEIRNDPYVRLANERRKLFESHRGRPPNLWSGKVIKFDMKPWIRNIKVQFHCDDFESEAATQLASLLELPLLRQAEIEIHGRCTPAGASNVVDLKIQQIADVCKKIRGKIGSGLRVRVLKSWATNYPYQGREHFTIFRPQLPWEDISCMWESTSHEVRPETKERFGTHKEHIKVLMSMDEALQGVISFSGYITGFKTT